MKLKKPLVFLDLETTGLDVSKDRIVELALLKVMPSGEKIKFPKSGRLLINPTIPIEAEASKVNGILDEDVMDCPKFSEIASQVHEFISGCDFAGYNSNGFDIPLLAEELFRCGIRFKVEGVFFVDVMKIFKAFEKRTLAAAHKFYLGTELSGAHQAMNDVEASYNILMAQMERYGGPGEVYDNAGGLMEPIGEEIENISKVFSPFERLDPAGYFILNENGDACFDFGKHKGEPINKVFIDDTRYVGWIMGADFPQSTKAILKRYTGMI